MFLVLCEPSDAAAAWAHEGLAARGLQPVERVTSADLAYARWVHRVGAAGASVEIALPDGRTIRGSEVRGTLNRLLYAPRDPLVLVEPSDRDYVVQELSAFYMSWLRSLPGPMLNRATPQSLCGRVRHISEWMWLAGRAGLPVNDYSQSSAAAPAEYALHARVPGAPHSLQTAIVVKGEVFGPAADNGVAGGCARLAELADAPLLGVELAVMPDGTHRFAGATSCPDLRIGGESMLDRLAECLT